MQITMLLHLGHHSITLIFDMPLWLPLIVVVLLSWNWGASWFAAARPRVIVRSARSVRNEVPQIEKLAPRRHPLATKAVSTAI